MKKHSTTTLFYRWVPAFTMAGFIALPLAGGVGLTEWNASLVSVEGETDWTLASEKKIEEPNVDWTLTFKNAGEDETDWTLAKSETIDEEEVDWTLA